ncbi:hypothetical protein ACWEJ6_47895 [Nonomuraea sp. NPDC004702]
MRRTPIVLALAGVLALTSCSSSAEPGAQSAAPGSAAAPAAGGRSE